MGSAFAWQVEQFVEENGESQHNVRPDEQIKNDQKNVVENQQGAKAKDGHRVEDEVAEGLFEEGARVTEKRHISCQGPLPVS